MKNSNILAIAMKQDALNTSPDYYKGYIQLVEDDYRHWLTPKIRLAIYSFFMKHLGISGDPDRQHCVARLYGIRHHRH